ncbi:glycine zipper 2TM domain-containing protein [Rhodosalinus sp. FB01]|uniref:glycine zipper 2TM domain-containing protein n=1 Tax=Rhodosalinus sp. FB01 TaxID=3239194 RepID=UPI003524055B
MRRLSLAFTCTAMLAVSACENLTREERVVVGGLTGAAVGLITARELTDDDDWVIIGTLTGAAAGALIARNRDTGRCAYATRGGGYRVAPC